MADREQVDPFIPTVELAEKIRTGACSPTAVVEQYLDEIAARDEEINAYVTVTDELARETAQTAEQQLQERQDIGPLHGVPIALKDLRDMKAGVPHSFGVKLVGEMGYVAERTSAVVERLEDAGAVIIGKTNTPEFGHKGVTDNEYIGPTASPLDTNSNAGGSSGGSAAAVAAGMASAAMGSDTGGSIRIPAAACGVFGHKPSYGLVPLDSRPNAFGTKTHHSVMGPLTRTVEDAALILDIITGYHPRDPGSVPVDIDFQAAVDQPVDELKIGYSPDLDVFPVESEIEQAVSTSVDALATAGATVERTEIGHGVSLDELCETVETTFATTFVGVAAVVKETVGIDLRNYPDAVSESLLELLAVGDEKTVEDVAKTGIVRTQLFDAFQDLYETYDLLVTPTLATGQMDLETDQGQDWELALTWPFNWTGHPAASVPAGRIGDNKGVAAAQIVGPQYHDDRVLAASAVLERARPWHEQYPR